MGNIKTTYIRGNVINLGRQGENDARMVEITTNPDWLELYGSGEFAVVYRRPDGLTYPVPVEVSGGVVCWVPSAADTSVAGDGEAELRYTVGGVVVKSELIKTYVSRALPDGGEQPATEPDYVQRVIAAADMAEQSAENAAGCVTAAASSAKSAEDAAKGVEDKLVELAAMLNEI